MREGSDRITRNIAYNIYYADFFHSGMKPFYNLPVLEIDHGRQRIGQHLAICRFLAKRFGKFSRIMEIHADNFPVHIVTCTAHKILAKSCLSDSGEIAKRQTGTDNERSLQISIGCGVLHVSFSRRGVADAQLPQPYLSIIQVWMGGPIWIRLKRICTWTARMSFMAPWDLTWEP